MQTLPSGIKKVEASDNATVVNFNINADLLDEKITKLDGVAAGAGGAGSATDSVIGNRAIDDSIVAAAGADSPTRLWSKLAYIIKGITGSANWWTLPSMTINVIVASLGLKAPLASPTFTGTASAPYFKATGDTTRNLAAAGWADLSANSGGQALLANNAYTDGNNSWKYSNTHASLGARGIRLSVSGGIECFDMGAVATTADAAFTPTWVKMATLLSPAFTGTPTAPTFSSTIATGTPPLSVESTTTVPKLGADTVDGWHIFYDITQLGLTAGTETIEDICLAMPMMSMLVYTKKASNTSTAYPITDGILVIKKSGVSNVADLKFSFYNGGGNVQQWSGYYNWNGSPPFSGWVKEYNGSTTGIDVDTVDGFHMNQDVRTTASPTFSGITLPSASLAVASIGNHNPFVGSMPTFNVPVNYPTLMGNVAWQLSKIIGGTDWTTQPAVSLANKANNASPSFTGTANFAGQINSTVATGTAPLQVASTTVVTNLNADMVDGFHADKVATANTLVARDSAGGINGVVLNSYAPQGVAPLWVTSTTQVANLNADMVNGHHVTTSSTAPSGGVDGDIWIQY
ncbi:hypothetical protein Back11_11840 [Paenibacillus baekrokdamisoli]|uniref:Uncharacterized protein n=1 Tax=Paenibacillus baekrokdamisoli TaxID=1712516 RepID=A0A3G9JA30_9BACL|nr:hypothetical protein [Paenibacillus baekrokdamisoli]MBB3070489.1 hypothetical protein [Paenibacillus baekrokdamisoli]BBH19839.1 hypothetical protein Back11_11840 [Paenibacillus baekrokdamisoli]